MGRNFSVVLELDFLASSKKRADFASLILFDLCVRSGSVVGSAVPFNRAPARSLRRRGKPLRDLSALCLLQVSLSIIQVVGADNLKRHGSSGRWTKLAPFLAGRTGVSRERRKRKRRFREMCLVEMCLIEMCLGHSLRLWCRLWRKPYLEWKSISTSAWMGWGFGWVLVGC